MRSWPIFLEIRVTRKRGSHIASLITFPCNQRLFVRVDNLSAGNQRLRKRSMCWPHSCKVSHRENGSFILYEYTFMEKYRTVVYARKVSYSKIIPKVVTFSRAQPRIWVLIGGLTCVTPTSERHVLGEVIDFRRAARRYKYSCFYVNQGDLARFPTGW